MPLYLLFSMSQISDLRVIRVLFRVEGYLALSLPSQKVNRPPPAALPQPITAVVLRPCVRMIWCTLASAKRL